MAREAHELLCSYDPESLNTSARGGWPGDAEIFSQWLAEFNMRCEADGLLSTAQLPLELLARLQHESVERVPLLLSGFDRILPTQRSFLEAWGRWELEVNDRPAAAAAYYAVPDAGAELAACALWCRRHLDQNPDARLLIVSQDAGLRRGEIERAFHRHLGRSNGSVSPLEFSLGIPLAHIPLARGAMLLLRWLNQPILEHELDWLLSTDSTSEGRADTAALQHYMQEIRRRNQQRPSWTLEAFLNAQPGGLKVPESWSRRMLTAARMLQEAEKQPALGWAALIPRIMKEAGWPGQSPMASASFQALDHWAKNIEECGTLGYDEQTLSWPVFHSALARQLENTLFTPESQGAHIVVTGAVQSGGLSADGIWFLGAEEDTWPLNGTVHPFLPNFLQKEHCMPHSSTELDSELSQIVTARLVHSTAEICFSHAALRSKADANPSRLAIQYAGDPVRLPSYLVPVPSPLPSARLFEDGSQVPFTPAKVTGGSSTLTLQSQCAFKAFATARLAAQSWDAAETGLNPRQRGELVHAILNSAWGGPTTNGWQTSDELATLLSAEGTDGVEKFVAGHVQSVLQLKLSPKLRERMPGRYLQIEEKRLVQLITEWLLYEATRARFVVGRVEAKTAVTIAGLEFDLRLDRLDTLEDGTKLVVDYKTGAASPSKWELPRPEDVQLPIYSAFAVEQEACGGLVFASLRTGELAFSGKVRQSVALLPNLSRASSLVKNPLTNEHLEEWRSAVEQLARDFISGRAIVNPRDSTTTCEHCTLKSLCRIEDNRPKCGFGEASELA
jgi:probable DNA repair protein